MRVGRIIEFIEVFRILGSFKFSGLLGLLGLLGVLGLSWFYGSRILEI